MGPRIFNSQDQGRDDLSSSCLLRSGHQPGLQSVFQLLQVRTISEVFGGANERVVSVTGTLQCGTSTTRLWSDSSRATQTGPAALIFLLTAPSSGLGAWTTLSGHGTSGREDSSSNTTSAVRSSVWVTAQLETGCLWEWRTAMLKFSIPFLYLDR